MGFIAAVTLSMLGESRIEPGASQPRVGLLLFGAFGERGSRTSSLVAAVPATFTFSKRNS
jgi:hypothetical protein